ncbi:MAG: hypothetical protein U9P07_11835 [Pseudomonadota bacterium]|nr:hypothetical protein [Pseudomonadota bacterium]
MNKINPTTQRPGNHRDHFFRWQIFLQRSHGQTPYFSAFYETENFELFLTDDKMPIKNISGNNNKTSAKVWKNLVNQFRTEVRHEKDDQIDDSDCGTCDVFISNNYYGFLPMREGGR